MKLLILAYAALSLAALTRVNDKNFKEVVIDSGKYVLVDFYADWCRHCMNLMPAIEELAETYADVPEVEVVKINGDEDGRKMTKKYDLPGFPTLLLFHGEEKPIEYEGLRDAESISNFIQLASKIRLPSAAEEVSSLVIQLTDYNFKTDVLWAPYKTLVLFSENDKKSKKLHSIWNELTGVYAAEEDQVRFGRVDLDPKNKPQIKNMLTLFGVTHSPMILFFDPAKVDADGLKRPAYYSGDLSLSGFTNYVNIVAGLDRDTEGRLSDSAGRSHAIELLFAKNPADVFPFIAQLESQIEKSGVEAMIEQKVLSLVDDLKMLAYYKRAVAHYIKDGKASLERESNRLKTILAGGKANVDTAALDYMQKRYNVLSSLLKH